MRKLRTFGDTRFGRFQSDGRKRGTFCSCIAALSDFSEQYSSRFSAFIARLLICCFVLPLVLVLS